MIPFQARHDASNGMIPFQTPRSHDGLQDMLQHSINDFRRQLGRAIQTTHYNIDIIEEGSSKAILVFTLVTIIFLPLSFVATVFGMNTSDVRGMDSTQGLFWAVALPVTVTIGAMSMLAAYGGPWLRDQMRKARDIAARILAMAISGGKRLQLKKTGRRDEEKAETGVVTVFRTGADVKQHRKGSSVSRMKDKSTRRGR
ncbi:hypothetical protein CC86DRAFT_140153 [Ophiobolus disseminans]|uniref:Cora-domain-containing protein n=1 Tax=Ophiobolus disseminans TaxID=1469910 RepID=A0A6A7AE35_9PLEO|nr:hypothetical protein CC86DRAFT_140153 [Ophiobolus disseminans]